MSFPSYPEYRDSGVGWLGDVPCTWKKKPLFALVRELDDKNDGMQESNLLSLSYGRIKRKSIEGADGLLPASFETYQIVERDDIVWRLTDLQNDQRSLRTGIVRERGIITSAYLATRPTGILPEFLAYLLRAYDLTKVFYSMGGGLRQSMKFSDVKWLPVMLPSGNEQQAIAAFLDRETAKIDALVAEQERLIALLKEKRQAVISQAVTKSLDPDAPMKDSGIEWLGEIPAHWAVWPLRRVIAQFVDYRGATPNKVDEGVPLITAGQIKNGRIDHDLDPVFITEEEYETRMTRGFPARGDLLLTTEAPLGEAALIEEERVAPGQRIILMKVKPDLYSSRYLLGHFRSQFGQSELLTRASGSTASGIRADRLRASRVLVPPLEEQAAIEVHIDDVTRSFDGVIAEAMAAIELMQERRAALISAAVTGKIDVRELVSADNVASIDTARTYERSYTIHGAVGAQAIAKLGKLGRMAVMKGGFLAEAHAGITEVGGHYERAAAGPYSRAVVQMMEQDASAQFGITMREGDQRVEYTVPNDASISRDVLRDLVGSDRAERFLNLLDLLKDLGRNPVEAIATLYAAWNDLTAQSGDPSNEAIIDEVLNEWDAEKAAKFSRLDLETWLAWMGRHDIVPDGNGPRTDHQVRLF